MKQFFLTLFITGLISIHLKAQVYDGDAADTLISGAKKVWIDESTYTLKYVRLRNDFFISDTNQVDWLTQSLQLPDDCSIILTNTEDDRLGYTHYKYDFSYNNYKIVNFTFKVHTLQGKVVSANGYYFPGIVSDTAPSIPESTAFQNAIQYFGAQQYIWQADSNLTRPIGNLQYFPMDGDYILSYYYLIHSTSPVDTKKIYVNANSGDIVAAYSFAFADNQPNTTAITKYNGTVSNMTTDRVSLNNFRLREYNVGINSQMQGIETFNLHNTSVIPSSVITDFWDSDNFWNNINTYQDEVATDIHWGIERAYDFFWNHFNRNSWDNNGVKIQNYVHALGRNGSPVGAWCFPTKLFLTFGDGDGISSSPFASLDIVTHEFTHGVTHFTAGFIHDDPQNGYNWKETGALDESFCDIMGITNDLETHPSTANYILGDQVTTDIDLLRNISNPKQYYKPDTYYGEYCEDPELIKYHHLGMIQSFWYYLLSEGGTGQNDMPIQPQAIVDKGLFYRIQGIGMDKAVQIAYRNFAYYLEPLSKFYEARFYAIESAIDLYGECSDEHKQTERAWDAVGVYNNHDNTHDFITVTTDQTWSGNSPNSLPAPVTNGNEIWINGSLTIEPSISLTINNGAVLKFGTSGKIIVEEGATLILDDVIVDEFSSCDCNWQSLVIVKQGGSLEVNNGSVIYMSSEGKVIIERGGELVIESSRITTHDDMWLGIEVHGNSDEIQAAVYQGALEINGGTIENAICAVKTYKPDPSMDTDPLDPQYSGMEGWTGGIVQATNATFRNNRNAVVFAPYQNGSTSAFDRCTFETTGELPDASSPDYFVRINSITGIHFYGCTFQNTNSDPNLLPEDRGSGIYAYNTTLYLMKSTTSAPATEGTFSNLYYGARDLSSGVNWPTVVENQNFLDNFRGIYLGGRNYVEFTENYIRPYAEQVTQNPQTYGVYFDQCTGYHIEANTFDSEITNRTGIGLIIHKSGSTANEVYRNTFSNLRYATIAQSYNRGKESEGLCYKCNIFTNNLNDIKISPDTSIFLNIIDGIAAHQGANIAGNDQAPAGNLFTNDNSLAFSNSGNGIIYYRHEAPPSLMYRINPYGYIQGTGVVSVIPVSGTTYQTTSCPSKLDLGGGGSEEDMDMMADAGAEADAIVADLTALNDGGNTDVLTQTVVTSTATQSLDLRNELLAVSPYLTDTVLDASIQQEEALPNALLRDVMVANPQSAKSDELLTKLENRQTPMPNDMWNEIMAGVSVTGDKENKEAAYGYWKNEEYYRWSRINRRMLLNQVVADSMINLWSNSDLAEARSNLALYYLASGNATQAIAILDSALTSIPAGTTEWDELTALHGYILTFAPAYPSPDSTMTTSFETLMDESEGQAKAFCRNALIQSGAINYNEPILVDEGLKSASTHKFGLRPVEENNPELLSVYPNPAKGYFVAKVKLTGHNGVLSLISPIGVIVMEKQVDNPSSVTIPVSHLPAGVYTVRLLENGVLKATVKVTLQ